MTWFDWTSLVIAIAGSIIGISVMFWATRRDTTRDDELEARSFHDEHGHWPGEAPPDDEPVAVAEGVAMGAPPLVRRRGPRGRGERVRDRLHL